MRRRCGSSASPRSPPAGSRRARPSTSPSGSAAATPASITSPPAPRACGSTGTPPSTAARTTAAPSSATKSQRHPTGRTAPRDDRSPADPGTEPGPITKTIPITTRLAHAMLAARAGWTLSPRKGPGVTGELFMQRLQAQVADKLDADRLARYIAMRDAVRDAVAPVERRRPEGGREGARGLCRAPAGCRERPRAGRTWRDSGFTRPGPISTSAVETPPRPRRACTARWTATPGWSRCTVTI